MGLIFLIGTQPRVDGTLMNAAQVGSAFIRKISVYLCPFPLRPPSSSMRESLGRPIPLGLGVPHIGARQNKLVSKVRFLHQPLLRSRQAPATARLALRDGDSGREKLVLPRPQLRSRRSGGAGAQSDPPKTGNMPASANI
jgi:hypothetical protein